MKLQIHTPHGQPITELDVSANASVADLKQAFFKTIPKFYPSRQRFMIYQNGEHTVLQKEKLLTHYGLTPNKDNIIEFKDLGPQFTWRTVYMTEYMGPFLLYLWIFLKPEILYGPTTSSPTYVQWLACTCFIGHFFRRLFESAFVHKWSGDTLGIYFLLKNSAYYWIAGALIGYSTNHPDFVSLVDNAHVEVAVLIFWLAEAANAWIHLQLSWARSAGSTAKVIPRGFLWTITCVSFPNYFFEIIIWITWNIAFFSIPGVLFLFCGTIQMGIWAKKKHILYLQYFDGKEGRQMYPRYRTAMIPFLF